MRASGPDRGGPFHMKRHLYSSKSNYDPTAILTGDFGTSYRGNMFAVSAVASKHFDPWPQISASSDAFLIQLGTKVIANVLPTNPVAGLTQFLGELHEGLPRVGIESFERRARTARSAGSDYLNYQFGWKPLVSDLRSFAHAVKDHDKILAFYEKNSGKPVKRKVDLGTDINQEVTQYSAKPSPDPYFWITAYINPGVMTRTIINSTHRWFSGAFTYFLEPPSDGFSQGMRRHLQRANKLLGIRLTPEVLWDLTPWSWAADWFANTGSVLHNLRAFQQDGLVMPYAYLMEEKTSSYTYELNGVTFDHYNGGFAGPFNFTQNFTTIVKRRIGASPFGFGLNPIFDFTDRQLAITAALGFQRRGKSRK